MSLWLSVMFVKISLFVHEYCVFIWNKSPNILDSTTDVTYIDATVIVTFATLAGRFLSRLC